MDSHKFDWLAKMNAAMEYIEENLASDISYEKAAALACCSLYHFQRMFSFITGVTLLEYVRRRRLTLAAFELQTSDVKVIDTAIKYGYDSPEAFSRAFKSLHNVSPKDVRGYNVSLKAFPKMTFSITIKGDVEMNYRIEERDAFEVFGVYAVVGRSMEQAFLDIPRFCERCDEDGTVDRMNELLGKFTDSYLNAVLYDHNDDGFKYMLCNYLPKTAVIPNEYTKLAVKKCTWAMFTVPECNMQDVWRRIYSEWFPTSEFEQVEGPCMEMYFGQASHENGFGEIWIPVQKKK